MRNCTLCNRVAISSSIIQSAALIFFIRIGCFVFFIWLDSCLSTNSEILCIHIIIEVVKEHSAWKSYEFQVVVCNVSILLEKCLKSGMMLCLRCGPVFYFVQHSLSLYVCFIEETTTLFPICLLVCLLFVRYKLYNLTKWFHGKMSIAVMCHCCKICSH